MLLPLVSQPSRWHFTLTDTQTLRLLRDLPSDPQSRDKAWLGTRMHAKAAARSTGPLATGPTQASDHKVLKQKFKKVHYEACHTIVEIKYCIEQYSTRDRRP